MKNGIKTYSIPVTVMQNINVDFEKIYRTIKDEYPDDDIYAIHETFGDNMNYYLKEVCDIEMPVCDNPDGYEYIYDEIWEDFYKWLETVH